MSLGPIDWQGNGAQLFLNPRLSKNETDLLEQSFFACDQAHQAIGVMSSGTTESQEKKIILLSRSAFLASAEAVNQHLQVKASDVWYHCLPDFHVGGLSIWARAFLSGSSVVRHQGGGIHRYSPTRCGRAKPLGPHWCPPRFLIWCNRSCERRSRCVVFS